MLTLFCVALITVLGFLIMMGRLNLKRFLGYPNLVDITFTVLMLLMFEGTFSGMFVAAVASLFMSLMLWVLRSSIGAERLAVARGRFGLPKGLYWRTIKASECQPHWISRLFMAVVSPKTQEA